MKFKDFIVARNRICNTNRCFTCPLGRNRSGYDLPCTVLVYSHPKTAETIVKAWLKSHKEEENQ